MKYHRVSRKAVHMLKERKGPEVTTRCRLIIKMQPNQAIPDISVTGWEKDVTCKDCVL